LFFFSEQNTEFIHQILESYDFFQTGKIEKCVSKVEYFRCAADGEDIETFRSCLDAIETIDDQKLRYFLLMKLIIAAVRHAFDLLPLTPQLTDSALQFRTIDFDHKLKDHFHAILLSASDLNQLDEKLLNLFLGFSTTEELAQKSPSSLVFHDMAMFDKKSKLREIELNEVSIAALFEGIDVEIKVNQFNSNLSAGFLEIIGNVQCDYLLHPNLKKSLLEGFNHFPTQVFEFLKLLCSSYRFDELEVLLDHLPLFSEVNKVSVLTKLHDEFLLEYDVRYRVKKLLNVFLAQWLSHLSPSNNPEMNHTILDYVLKKMDRFELHVQGSESRNLIRQISKFCHEQQIDRFDQSIIRFHQSNEAEKPDACGNSQELKAMLSRCGVEGTARQLLRINLIDFYELGYRVLAEGMQDDFYDALKLHSTKNPSSEHQAPMVRDAYWRIIAQIEGIRTFEQYNLRIQKIFSDIGSLQVDMDDTSKKGELYLELLCLAKRFQCEDDFIAFFQAVFSLNHVDVSFLRCACSLVFFYNPYFYTDVYEKTSVNFALKNTIDQRMMLAYHRTKNCIEPGELKFIYKLISTNSVLTKYYLYGK
jgi:hypothetical protein